MHSTVGRYEKEQKSVLRSLHFLEIGFLAHQTGHQPFGVLSALLIGRYVLLELVPSQELVVSFQLPHRAFVLAFVTTVQFLVLGFGAFRRFELFLFRVEILFQLWLQKLEFRLGAADVVAMSQKLARKRSTLALLPQLVHFVLDVTVERFSLVHHAQYRREDFRPTRKFSVHLAQPVDQFQSAQSNS